MIGSVAVEEAVGAGVLVRDVLGEHMPDHHHPPNTKWGGATSRKLRVALRHFSLGYFSPAAAGLRAMRPNHYALS